VARADRHRDERRGDQLRQARRHHQRRDVRAVQLGLDPRPGSRLRAVVVHVRPAAAGRQRVREQRLVLLQPRVRRALSPAARRARSRGAMGDRPRDAADLLRGRGLRDHVVRPGALGVAERPVHGIRAAARAER
jgi:hypothetical protein